jgi:hypothetical protein
MVALILGKPDAVIERFTEVEKTLLCNERGQPIKTYKGLSKQGERTQIYTKHLSGILE